ncbi:ABC transporter ATP-binding protein [Sphingomonas canadensis]|uniref:ABC transporter ATP-binding protein n=1 Tax=Sphingomonas canadensis TaxID=1219257 RepID=A0ABW3H6V6_9SPHN|nr:ABC transporter ATP-binding protein [Sphingomonas canadensis]MCW3837124.1 ABC transporter ATP-binding protein/permease [Sphingomonas canadensis]
MNEADMIESLAPKPKGVEPPETVLSSLRRLWARLPRRRRIHVALVPIPILLAALAETASLGVMLPFLAVLAAPERVFSIPAVQGFANMLGVSTPQELLGPLTIAFAVVVMGSAALRMLVAWGNSRLAYAIGEDIAMEVFNRTLHQPYSLHAQRNSASVLSALVKIKATSLTLVNTLAMVSSTMIATFIIVSLLIINLKVALGCFFVLAGMYSVIMLITRRRLSANSRVAAKAHTRGMQTVSEALGGIRDVLLDGNQAYFYREYHRSVHAVARAQSNSYFVSYSPRYAIEGLGMTIFVLVAYTLTGQSGGFAAALPLLGTFALGAQRLLPVLQLIYLGWANLRANQATLQDILVFLDQTVGADFGKVPPEPLRMERSVAFDKVSFSYAGTDQAKVVDGISFTAAKGQRIGFLGSTGSGKSTTFDLLMGLLTPTEGAILVDGVPLTDANRLAWQRGIAHVPQTIYLSDSTIAANIAFGVPAKKIDMDRVRDAARKAQIAEFIESHPGGYDAPIGERGVRLSGGQRQRIGIARALYKEAQVLVLDEATSALDNSTEESVMEAIRGLGTELTIFMIAHRLTTLSVCDTVIELDHGKITAIGSYDEIVQQRLHRPAA